MGIFKALQQKKCVSLNYKNRGRTFYLPLSLFQLIKLFLDGLLPSRAHLRFTLQDKYMLSIINKQIILLTESGKF